MNIVILPSWFRMKSNIISGSFFLEQAIAMAKLGHKVTIINAQIIPTRTYLKYERDIGVKHYEESGVEIYEYKTGAYCTGMSATITTKWYEKKVERILKKILKKQNVDILHGHTFYPAGIAAVNLGKKYNIPSVITEHFTALITGSLTVKKAYDYVKPTFDDANAVSCVSRYFSDVVYEKYNLHTAPEVTPNILNTAFKYSGNTSTTPFVFTTIGRLIDHKRPHKIIEALAKVKNAGYNVKLNVIGDGADREKLENLANELGISDDVIFFGYIPREDVSEYLKKSNVYVHTSIVETFGVVYMEALAAGCPVVAVKNGACEEIVNNDNGYLVDPDNEEQLVKAMIDVIENYDRFDRFEISRATREKYSEMTVAKKYEDLYNLAISNFNNK